MERRDGAHLEQMLAQAKISTQLVDGWLRRPVGGCLPRALIRMAQPEQRLSSRFRFAHSPFKALRRPSRPSRRVQKRNQSLILEDLEGRRLPSQAIQPLVTLPTANTSNMISGPDGDLWVGVSPTSSTAAIDRIGLNGSVTSFPVPENAPAALEFSIVSLTIGPDSNVWFVAEFVAGVGSKTNDEQVVLGKVTPAGLVTEFAPIPLPAGEAAEATRIVSGPRGDLWFGCWVVDTGGQGQDFIAQATTAGAVTLFPISSLGHSGGLVSSLAAGADGNLWFTKAGVPFVFGRMSPSGVVTQFPIHSQYTGETGNGPNGSLIVTVQNSRRQNEVFDASTVGAITRYKIPARISDAFVNYLGPAEGSLWFAVGIGSFRIGRITTSGLATSYNLSHFVRGREHFGDSMAPAEDGNLYVLDNTNTTATVYRLVPSELPPVRGVPPGGPAR